ncbi:MAG: hypothetical protein Q8M15_07735 [Bacteroidota bacterium]|nr:hypothetical protein [Bacteroidota bacterium]
MITNKKPIQTLVFFIVSACVFQIHAQNTQLLLSPNSGMPGQVLDVIIRSTEPVFKSGLSNIELGAGIILLKPIAVSNSMLATASIKIEPTALPGFRNVLVKNGTETVVETQDAFEIFNPGGVNNFRATIELLPLEGYSLSDFDVTNPASQPIFYFVNLFNDNTPRSVKIYITIKTDKYGLVGKVSINKRDLSANEMLRLNNRNFEKFEVASANGGYFLTEIKIKGVLPPDNYEYHLIVEENGVIIGEDISKTVVTNPVFNPELIAPGANFSANPEKIYTAFPLFHWFGQANNYDIALYKVMAGQSPEEVVRNVAVFKASDLKGSSFIYPAYAEKLIDGQMYAWQIKAKIINSKGVQNLPSEVFRFMFSSISDPAGGSKSLSKILVTPQEIELKSGESFQFIVQFFDQDNLPIFNMKADWKVVPPGSNINSEGLFTAGNSASTVAVIAKYGELQDYATVTIKLKEIAPAESYSDWMMDAMLKQLFGLPKR